MKQMTKRALVLLLSLALMLGPCQGALAMPGDQESDAPAVSENGGTDEGAESGGEEDRPGGETEQESPDGEPGGQAPDGGEGDSEEVPDGEERPDTDPGRDRDDEDGEELSVTILAEDAVILRGSSFDLLEGVTAQDETGRAVEVEVADDGGFDPGETGEYSVTYSAVHPVGGEAFQADRLVTVAAFLYDPQPESAEEVQAIIDLWTEAVLSIYGDGEINQDTVIELDYYAGDENSVSGDGISSGKETGNETEEADADSGENPEDDPGQDGEEAPADPEDEGGEEAETETDGEQTPPDGGQNGQEERDGDSAPDSPGSEREDQPDSMLPYKVTMGAELLTGIEGEVFEALEAVLPELPKWEEAIDPEWIPAGWTQEQRTDPESGQDYWTLVIGVMKLAGEETDLSGMWSYVKTGSGSSETASNTTTVNVEDLNDASIFPNGMPGFYYNYYSQTYYRYYQYNANFIVNFPTIGNTYKVRASIPEGWDIDVYNFPLDSAGYLTDRTLTNNPDGSYTLEYTVDDTKSGTTTFNFNAMYLDTAKMYPGMNLDINVELLDLTGGTEVVLATQELKAQIRKYDNRSVYYQPGGNGATAVTQDPSETWGDPTLADGYAPESGTRSNTIYTYKGGDLIGSNWGVTNSNYQNETTLTHDISEFELDLSKLYVGTITSTNSTLLANPDYWEKITSVQLQNLEVTGTSVDSYDPDTGIVTFKGTYQSFSLSIQLKNWNNLSIWPRSELAASGSSGYTTLLLPSAAGFDTDGQIPSTPDHLYLNGIQIEDAKAEFTNNGKFSSPAYWQFYQTYTPITVVEPVFFYVQAPSRVYYSYWQTGVEYQPLFRFGLYTRQYTAGTTHQVSPELYDLSLDIDIPADLTITHLAVPVHMGDAYYSDHFTLSYGGHDETVYFRASSSEDAIIPLGTPIPGGSTVTFHIDYFCNDQQYFNTNVSGQIGSGYIEFIGDVDEGATPGTVTLGVTKDSISARLDDPAAAPTLGYDANNTNAVGNAGYGYTVSGVTMTVTEPTQFNQVVSPTFYAVSGDAPHTSATTELVIGESYYLSGYILGHATTTASNQRNSPLVYNGDGSWLDPVVYISLPDWMTTVRGDTDFTQEDLFTYIPGVQSVRTVPGVSGYYSGGTLVEVKFDSSYPHNGWDDTTDMTFDARYAWNWATTQMGTYSSATTPRFFLKFKVKMDSDTFPEQKTYHTLDTLAFLAGTYSSKRVESPHANYSKTVLDADGGRTADQLAGAPYYIDSSGEKLSNANANISFNVQWKENAYLSMGMQLEDGTFFEYIPEGENKTDPDDIPEMKAGDVGTMRVQIVNHSSYDLTTGSGSYATLELPKDNSGYNYWKTTAVSALVTDGENTVSSGLVTPKYSDDGGFTYSAAFPTSGNVTHISLDVSTIPKGSVYSAIFQFQVPRVDNDALYGTIGVGDTDYDLGYISGTSVKSDAGNTAALKLRRSDPPEITVGGPKRLEYNLNTGDDITGWMTDYTITDDITPNMGLAAGYPRVFFTPISEGVTGTETEITPVNANSVNNTAKGQYRIVYKTEDDYDRQNDSDERIIMVTDTTPDPLTVKHVDYAIQKGSATDWLAWFASDEYVEIDNTQDAVPNYSKLAVMSSPTFDVNTSGYYNLAFTYADPEGNLSMTSSRVKVGNLGAVGLAPELTAWDVTMGVGSGDATSYYWTKNTSAADVEDGDLTASVYVTSITDIYGNSWTGLSPNNLPPAFDPNTPNRYEVAYEVQDSDGNKDTATAVVMVANWNGTDYDPWIVAPAGKSVPSNVTVGYDFTIVNPNAAAISLTDLTLTSSNSYVVSLPGGSSVSLPYGKSTVAANVTIPAGLSNGHTDDLTLSATYRGTPIADFTTTTIDNTLPYQEVYIVSQDNSTLTARVSFQNLPGNPSTANTTVRLLDQNGAPLMGKEINNPNYSNNQPIFVFTVSDLIFNTEPYQIQSEVVGVDYPSTKPFTLTSYHTVTFHSNGGSAVAPITNVPYNTTVSAPTSPTRTGYTFVNWYTDDNVWSSIWVFPMNTVTADTDLYAKWDPLTFNVIFDLNDSVGSTTATLNGASSITVTYDQKYGTLPTASRTGYDFAGWFTAANGGTQVTANTDVKLLTNQTLYAHWNVKSHTVTFNKNDGAGSTTAASPSPASKTVVFDQPYGALASSARDGYTLAGWYTAANGGTQVTAATSMTTDSSHTLFARWTPNTYTVTFDLNGGDSLNPAAPNTKTVTFDATYGTFPGADRLGYFFLGWYDSPTGGSRVYETDQVLTFSNHTLYAQWTKIHTATFMSTGGSYIAPNNYVLDGTLLPWPGSPQRKGYTFIGGYKSANGRNAWDFEHELVYQDLVLYARWRSDTPGSDTPDGDNRPDGGDGGSGGGAGGSGEGPGGENGQGQLENGDLIIIGDDQVPLGDLPIGNTSASGDSILGVNPFSGDTRRGIGLAAGLLAASAAALTVLRKKRRRDNTGE